MTTGQRDFIDNLVVELDRRPAELSFSVHYEINWSDFDQITNLRYRETWRLVHTAPAGDRTLWTAPVVANGICANGQVRTSRRRCGRATWTELDLDPAGPGGLAVSVELVPLLPETRTARSLAVALRD